MAGQCALQAVCVVHSCQLKAVVQPITLLVQAPRRLQEAVVYKGVVAATTSPTGPLQRMGVDTVLCVATLLAWGAVY